MTQTYRTDDLAKWGSGKGSNLTPAEVDINFWDVIQRIITLEALPSAAAGIDHFTVSGTQFYVVMTDSSTLGPYELPVATFFHRGEWEVDTAYSVLDTFTVNGGLYSVIFAHTSDPTTFDAGANDGFGHEYYVLMIQTPGSSLPTGGAVGQVLEKATSGDYVTTWGWKTPSGGTARKYLIQQSSTQDDAEWETPTAADIEFVPITDSTLASDNVADALEELALAAAVFSGDASDVTYTPPTGSTLISTDVQGAIDELEENSVSGVSLGGFSASPTGNVSTTEKAMGLGSSFAFTPEKSGICLVWLAGMVLNSTAAGDGVTITGRYGTGTAPVNGATTGLGTQFGTPQHFIASTTAGQQGFTVMGKITSLSPGVIYWFDISIVAVTGGGATVKDVQVVAVEVGG